jgi:hypothetical protein
MNSEVGQLTSTLLKYHFSLMTKKLPTNISRTNHYYIVHDNTGLHACAKGHLVKR